MPRFFMVVGYLNSGTQWLWNKQLTLFISELILMINLISHIDIKYSTIIGNNFMITKLREDSNIHQVYISVIS